MSPEIQINCFGAQGQVPKSRNHRSEGLEGSHINKSRSYKLKMEHNTAELFHKFTIKMHKKSKQM